MFARKPAPVQVTYLGYPGTTGLATFDALLTDASRRSSWRAGPIHRGASPPARAVPTATPPRRTRPRWRPLPMLRAGFPTFGSLHKLPKLNSGVLDLWAALLRAIPAARLLLFRDTLKGRRREEILAHFEARGVIPERVEIRHDWRPDEHWAIYSSIDVSLDVFPWCGHTTACESLWMGVPVVTLAGDRRSSRMTASVLTMMGLTELIAETPEQYIEAASRLVSDPIRLSRTRGRAARADASLPLCDGPSFTRDLEAAYETLWRRWCNQQIGI